MASATDSATRPRFRHSLAFRIVVACGLLGTTLTAAFAFAVYVATEAFEHAIVEELLADERDAFVATLDAAAHGPVAVQLTNRLRAHAMPAVDLPDWLRNLDPGFHEVRGPEGEHYHVLVDGDHARRVVVTQRATELERRQARLALLLIAGALLGAYLSVWIGWLLSRRVIAPLARLSDDVGALPAGAPYGALAAQYPDDELGRLAAALDDYGLRLERALARERDFSADASHELRTPLAVIRGALELLDVANEPDPRRRAWLGRIVRATRDIEELVDVFLLLAREDATGADDVGPLHEAVARAAEAESAAEPELRARLAVVDVPARALVPGTRALSVAVGNLLRNAARHATGPIEVRLDGTTLRIRDGGPSPAGGAAGAGRGLHIVRRICDRFGWRFRTGTNAAGGTDALIDFGGTLTES